MADLSYTVDVNATPAITALKKVETQVKSVNDSFAKLKTALAGLAFGGFIAQAFQFADAIQDISDATNISTQTIIGFNQAVQMAGGTSERAQQGVLKFVQSIGEAADGSKKAQNAFDDVGISLEDLRTLSEQDLLQKTVNGLAKIDDAGKRSVVQMELFGKALRGVSAQGLAQAFGTASAESAKYATSIKAAADAQQNFENAISTIKLELLGALKPISELASGLLEAGSKAKEFIRAVFDIGVVVATFFAVTKAVKFLVAAFEALVAAPALITRGLSSLSKTWDIFLYQLKKVATSGGVTAQTLAGLEKRFHWVGVAINEIGKGLGVLAAGFVAFYKILVPDEVHNKVVALFTDLKELMGFKGSDNKSIVDPAELDKQAQAARAVEDAFLKQKKAIEQSSNAFRIQNNELIDNINLEKSFVGQSENYIEIIRAQEAIYKRAADEADKLRTARDQLGKDEQKLVPIYDAQIEKIKEQTQVDVARVTSALTGLQDLKLLEQDRLNNIQRITDALARQQSQAGVTSGIYSDMSKKLNEIMFGKEQRGRSIFDQQKAQIERNIQLLEADMAGAIMSAFETEDGYTNIQQMNAELQKMYDLTERLKQEQLSELNISNQWATGWQDAFTKYMDSATNAAKIAGEQFSAVTNGMNTAIDNFVENGKFSFKDMANSIIKDLLKIELKKQAAFALSGATSFLGNLFGGFFANGGNPPIGKASVVGENGPELFIPKTAGTIIPNGGTSNNNAPAGNTYITNNISAIDAKSVAQLFAENRRTLFGSVQMAQKEMSYGR